MPGEASPKVVSSEYRGETKPIEYVIGGLCVWYVLTGPIYGVPRVLGFDLGWGWAIFIALVITLAALVKIRKDDRPQLRALPHEGPLAQLFAQGGGAVQPPPVGPRAHVLAQSLPTDDQSPKARNEPKRKISAPDYFAGVFSIWILAMAINALVAGSVAWASLIALAITLSALLMIHRRERQPLRSLPTVGPLAQFLGKATRDQHLS